MDELNINIDDFEKPSEVLKVLGHPVRLGIVWGLLQKGSCNVSMVHECLGMPQSTISQHLGKLKAAGIVKVERRGIEMHYMVAGGNILSLVNAILKEI